MTELGGSKLTNIIKAKEDMNKSPEQLQAEKHEIIKSRLVRIQLHEDKQKLIKQATSFHELLGDLYDIIYDLNEKHERQKYDMMELTKRAIQVEKGKSKTRKSNIVHTGLGGSIFPWLSDVASNAPGKISLFSRYERVTDRRSFANRREIWEHNPEEEKKKREEEHMAERMTHRPTTNVNTNVRRQAYEKKEEENKPIERVQRKPVLSEPEEPEHVSEPEPEPEQHEPESEPESEHEQEREQEEQEEQHEPEPEDEHEEDEQETNHREENHDDVE